MKAFRRFTSVAASVLSGSILLVMPATAQVLRCDIGSKFQCDAGSGCKQAKTGIWNFVDLARRTIARCDPKGCDTYPAQFAVSGAFINIGLPDRGMMAKLSSDGTTFVETATLANTVFVSFGVCRQQ